MKLRNSFASSCTSLTATVALTPRQRRALRRYLGGEVIRCSRTAEDAAWFLRVKAGAGALRQRGGLVEWRNLNADELEQLRATFVGYWTLERLKPQRPDGAVIDVRRGYTHPPSELATLYGTQLPASGDKFIGPRFRLGEMHLAPLDIEVLPEMQVPII